MAAREFVRGTASRPDRVFIISRGKALMANDIAHSSVIAREEGRWADCVNTDWNSTAVAVARLPAPKLITVGEEGDVVVYLGGGTSVREKLKPAPVMIRNARGIGGYVFACGMKRQVYQRVDEKRWRDMSAPGPMPAETAGFEAIDGYSERELYAVGWGGEIWQFDGAAWTRRDSPTDAILSAVCCAPDGVVYAAGQRGTLLSGRDGAWEVVARDGVDIWDLCWFRDELYVATMQTLFRLAGNQLVEVDFGAVGRPTCYSLTTADGVLWSIGQHDVASFDGATWHRHR